MVYKKFVDEKAIAALKNLIGTDVQTIYSDGLAVYNEFIESQLFALKISDGLWLNFSNKAMETPSDNDYYEFIITESNSPQNLKLDNINNSIIYPFSKICLDNPRITSIEIYSRLETYNGEELHYDVVLLFHCENGFIFMISIEERVDEFLIYSSKPQIINKYIEGMVLRKSLI